MANTYTSLGGLFTAIANAIRAKKGTTDTIVADNFPSEIESIASQPSLQSKTVSPSTAAQTITPDSGYDGLSQVVVNAISPTKGAQTYTPTTTNQTISSGRWLTGAQTIKGDANLIASNIKSGVSIFGVSGAFPPRATDVNWHNNTNSTIIVLSSGVDHHSKIDISPNSTYTTHYNTLGNLSANIAYSSSNARISVREVADKVENSNSYESAYKDYIAYFFLKGSDGDNIDVYFD